MHIYLGIAIAVALAGVWGVSQYNSLVNLKNYIRVSWSDVDVELKRRYDLIPNLVAVVRGYAAHERDTFERVTELRNRCLANNGSPAEQAKDENQLVDALKQFHLVVENYPQLKADKHFLKLQEELANTENRIQVARRFYNGNVRDYRNKCEMFPSNLVARVFGFKSEADFFSVPPSMREVPDFDFNSAKANVVKILVVIAVIGLFAGCNRQPSPSATNATDTNIPASSPHWQPVAGTILRETAADWGVLLQQGNYRVINNVWNKGMAGGPNEQRVFLEKLNGTEAFGWQWSWPPARTVMAYPEVVYGDKPWDPPAGLPTDFPLPAGSRKITVGFDIRLTAKGTYTMAFTLWGISNTNNPKGSITHEIMIWIANRGGHPAGIKRGTLQASGVDFDVYVNPDQSDNSGANQNRWTYVAFVAQKPLLKGQLDLDTLTDYLLKQGIMAIPTYLTSLELGTEISSGEGKAEILDYEVRLATGSRTSLP